MKTDPNEPATIDPHYIPLLGRWLTNTLDPARSWENGEEEQSRLRWISENLQGPPRATEAYTREELERMGMVGVYAHPEVIQRRLLAELNKEGKQ